MSLLLKTRTIIVNSKALFFKEKCTDISDPITIVLATFLKLHYYQVYVRKYMNQSDPSTIPLVTFSPLHYF